MGDGYDCTFYRLQGQFQDAVESGYQIPPNKAKNSGSPGLIDCGLRIADCGLRIFWILDFGFWILDFGFWI